MIGQTQLDWKHIHFRNSAKLQCVGNSAEVLSIMLCPCSEATNATLSVSPSGYTMRVNVTSQTPVQSSHCFIGKPSVTKKPVALIVFLIFDFSLVRTTSWKSLSSVFSISRNQVRRGGWAMPGRRVAFIQLTFCKEWLSVSNLRRTPARQELSTNIRFPGLGVGIKNVGRMDYSVMVPRPGSESW